MEEDAQIVKFMKQKYLIALALAVIKNKPPDMTIIDFCHLIQRKVRAYYNIGNSNVEESNITTEAFDFDKSQLTEHFSNEIIGDNVTQSEETCEKIKLVKENIPQIWDIGMEKKMHKFNILQSLKNIKDIVSTLNGSSSYNGIFSTELDLDTNTTPTTQESGYQSASQSNLVDSQLIAYKRNNFADLDKSMEKIISFICDSPEKDYSHSIIDYMSDVLGRTFDILDKHNISITSSDKMTEEILNVIKTFSFENENHTLSNKDFYHESLVKKFRRLTKSVLFINFSLHELANELNKFRTNINNSLAGSPIEYENINYVDNSFYLFLLLEITIKQSKKSEKQAPLNESIKHSESKENKQYDIHDAWRKNWMPFQTNSRNILNVKIDKPNETLLIKDCLNKLIIECIDSYPLISFWAVECLNNLEEKSET